jgi:mannose-6-phosphate isomerase-like protein (cupin superfamily)
MNFPIGKENAEHYIWGDVCDGWHLLRDNHLSVIEERMPPGAREQRHFHARSRQFFYVLSGELIMELDGRQHYLEAGLGLEVSPCQPHQAINSSGAEVRFLVISQPPSLGDRHPA